MIVSDGIMATAAHAPDRPAIRRGDETLTYAQLAAEITRWQAAVGAARRVAITMHNAPGMVATFLGVVRAGAVAMALDPGWPADMRKRVLDRHTPNLVIDGDRPSAPGANTPPTPDSPFFSGFTSGTTGVPNGFIRTHASWRATFDAARAEFGPTASGRVLAPGPVSHSLTLYTAIETLEAGGTAILQAHFDAAICAALIADGEVDCIVGVPSMFELLVSATPAPVSRPIAIISAGAKLTPGLRGRLPTRYPAARLFEYYGASELSFVSVATPSDGAPPESVGRAFHGVDLIVRRDDGSVAAAGEIGTVWVRSAMLSNGYIDTDAVGGFRTDPSDPAWATVGDRGHLDARGFLFLAGREGDMLISGGHNIYPAEIEHVLASVPGVTGAAVLGIADPRWGHRLCAVVEGDVGRAVLEAGCLAALPRTKLPREWRRIASLPRTASGKVARAQVMDMLPTLETLT